VFQHPHKGLVPVYRYFSSAKNDHLYTTNQADIGTVHAGEHAEWFCEGVLGYISPGAFDGGVPVYRYDRGDRHDHLYTTNAGEIGKTHTGEVGNHGYKSEGILGYVAHK